MRAIVLFFLIASVAVLLLSCGDCSRKIDCPGYKDDTLDRWFPYRNNQQVIFVNGTGEADTATLKNTETTAPYQARSGAFGPPLHCQASKVFQSAETDTNKRYRFSLTLQTTAGERSANFSIHGDVFLLSSAKSDEHWWASTNQRTMTVQLQPLITLGNRSFTNVMEATGDTVSIKIPGIYKVYFQQGEGLVGYSYYPTLQTWIKP